MNLYQAAQRDAQNALSNPLGFSIPVTFTTPTLVSSPNYVTPSVTATVQAMTVKHAFDVSGMTQAGTLSRSKTARITVCEAVLVAAGFPTRNANKACTLKDCTVSFTDENGNLYTGIIVTPRPDDMVGIVVCELKDN